MKSLDTYYRSGWITDAVIFIYWSLLLSKYDYIKCHRMAVIDSLAIALPDRVNSWMRGLFLQDLDIVLMPYHVANRSHWIFVVAYIVTREVLVIDAFGSISNHITETSEDVL